MYKRQVLTNGLITACLLAPAPGITVYTTCGKVQPQLLSLSGPNAADFISRHHADLAFVSCRGLSSSSGITDYDEDNALIKRAYKNHADKTVLLADDSKFSRHFFHRTFEFSEISSIITNSPPPPDIAGICSRLNVNVIF